MAHQAEIVTEGSKVVGIRLSRTEVRGGTPGLTRHTVEVGGVLIEDHEIDTVIAMLQGMKGPVAQAKVQAAVIDGPNDWGHAIFDFGSEGPTEMALQLAVAALDFKGSDSDYPAYLRGILLGEIVEMESRRSAEDLAETFSKHGVPIKVTFERDPGEEP